VEQASILMQATGVRPQTVYVDLGYRGVDQANPDIAIKHRGRFKSLTDEERKNLKRRQAIEPIIGHLKADHRMNRCHLKGAQGDSLHAVLCAAGCNGAMGGEENSEVWRSSARAASTGCVGLFGFGLEMNFSGTTP